MVGSVLDTIGNTPLVRLRRCVPANGAELWLKLENTNPTGSMKDRMALAMVEGAERDGLLAPGDTVVEYTDWQRVDAFARALCADLGLVDPAARRPVEAGRG